MIGQTLGHYRIDSKLGEGGMGLVYRARDLHLDREVAIKVLPTETVADPERKRRFAQEAKAASALNHPNILHIYDISAQDGVDFIAMEYVKGETLAQRIGRKALPLQQTLKYASQIADALTTAHRAGIIHRDIKPSNLIVSDKGVVKVLDFGLAKLIEPSEPNPGSPTESMKADSAPRTEVGTVVGTVAYMSPEQAAGKNVDARSDIFSFGTTPYEMVTGRRPFQGDTKMSTLAAIIHHEPPPPSELLSLAARPGEDHRPLPAQGPGTASAAHGRCEAGARGTERRVGIREGSDSGTAAKICLVPLRSREGRCGGRRGCRCLVRGKLPPAGGLRHLPTAADNP